MWAIAQVRFRRLTAQPRPNEDRKATESLMCSAPPIGCSALRVSGNGL